MSEEKKRIVFIAPVLSKGGSERVISILANAFYEKGYPVTVALTRRNRWGYPLEEGIERLFNPYDASTKGQIRFLREVLKRYRGANFISFLTYQNMYTLLAGMGLGQHVIVSERNAPDRSLEGRNYLGTMRFVIYQLADVVVFQTKEAMGYFSRSIQKKGVVVENPLKTDLPLPFDGEREKRFVAVCRLSEQKNIPMMLRAFHLFRQEHPDYTLSIYGEGKARPQLEAYAESLGLKDWVSFCGFSGSVHEEILKATAYLSSSDFEGISNAMLEAMAIGLPCICTDCPAGGPKAYIRSGENGFLVPVGDHQAMADCMGRLAGDPALTAQMSEKARQLREQLSTEEVVKQWEKLLA